MSRAILGGCLMFAATVGLLAPAEAGVIQVPGPFAGATQILQGAPFGETFTAEDPFIQTVGFNIQDLNPATGPDDLSLTLSIYSDGLANLLGSKTFTGLTPGFTGPISVNFSQGIGPLTIGQTYTAIITDTTARWGVQHADSDSAYAGGNPVFQGVPVAGADLSLTVVSSSAVPTPSPLKLAGVGGACVLFLGVWRRVKAGKQGQPGQPRINCRSRRPALFI